jgi:FolB domain-containing protein
MPDSDKIIIADLRARGILGVHPHERRQAQDILINLTLHADLARAGHTDALADTLDYSAVAKAVVAYVEGASHLLVETLAAAIARICVVDLGAEAVVVRVEKPGAVRLARSVGVEVTRTRADFAA